MSQHDAIVGTLESRKDFEDNPEGQYRYWLSELDASEKMLREWKDMGTRIVHRFLGGAQRYRDSKVPDERGGLFQLNVFHTNVVTLQSILYGNLPKVRVDRRRTIERRLAAAGLVIPRGGQSPAAKHKRLQRTSARARQLGRRAQRLEDTAKELGTK